MDEDFRADSSDEEDTPMLQRMGSAAVNAKLSFELPGQSGLQVSIPSCVLRCAVLCAVCSRLRSRSTSIWTRSLHATFC